MRTAKIYNNKIAAGTLTENADGLFTFCYNDNYFTNPDCSPISPAFPKSRQEYCSKTLFPFFFNMLSEGVNKQIQSRKFKIDEDDHFGLLMATAHSDVVGAITVEKIIV